VFSVVQGTSVDWYVVTESKDISTEWASTCPGMSQCRQVFL